MLKSIQIRGYQSIKDIEYKFKPHTIYCIYGTEIKGDGNRVGKSTFIYAIIEALYGVSERGLGPNPGEIILEGQIDGKPGFKSHRRWTKSTNTWKIKFDDQDKPISGINKCRSAMVEYLGLSYEDFVRLQFLQKQSDNLTKMGETARSNKAIEYLEIPVYKKSLNTISGKISGFKTKLDNLQVEQAALKMINFDILPDLNHLQEQLLTLNLEVTASKTRLESLNMAFRKNETTHLDSIKKVAEQRQVVISKATAQTKLNDLVDVYNKIVVPLATQEDLQIQLDKLYQIKAGFDNIDSTIKQHNKNIRDYKEVKSEYITAETLVKKYTEKAFRDSQEIINSATQQVTEEVKLRQEVSDSANAVSLKEVRRARIVDTHNRHQKEMVDMQADFDTLDKVECPITQSKCPVLKAEDLAEKKEVYGQMLAKKHEDIAASTKALKVSDRCVKEANDRHKTAQEALEQFQTMPKVSQEEIKQNQGIVAEKGVWELSKKQKTDILEKISEKGYHKEYVSEQELEINKLEKVIDKSETVTQDIIKVKGFQDTWQRRKQKQKEVETASKEFNAYADDSEIVFEILENELKSLAQQNSDGQTAITTENNTLKAHEIQQYGIQVKVKEAATSHDQYTRFKTIQSDIESAEKSRYLWAQIESFFKALPIYNFEQKLSTLETMTQNYKNILTDRFDIKFSSFHEFESSGAIKMTWSIKLEDELCARKVPPGASGAEEDVINFAIKSAFQDMLRAKKNIPSVMIYDEPFTSYADAKIDNFLEYLIGTLKNQYQQILLVAHDPRIKTQLPNSLLGIEHIELIREDGYTRLK